MTVGWRVESVNLEREEVTFKKEPASKDSSTKKTRRRRTSKKAFRELVHKKFGRPSVLPPSYRGLKPRSAYEKRLYKPGEKPK